MIRTLVIEDEMLAIDAIEVLIGYLKHDLRIVGTAADFESAVQLIESTKPDLVFLDIQLSDCSGFDVLKHTKFRNMEIIFTTAFSQFAVKAFEENAIGYLLKPIDPELFEKTVDRAVSIIGNQGQTAAKNSGIDRILEKFNRSFTVTNSEGTHVIDIMEVVQVEGSGAYSNIELKSGDKIMVSKNIGQFEADLRPSGFIRCHRSHLVNTEHIVRIQRQANGMLELSNGTRVPVSRSRRQELASLFKRR